MPVLNFAVLTLQARRHLLQAPTPAPVPVTSRSLYRSVFALCCDLQSLLLAS